jgi:hypothetical protein
VAYYVETVESIDAYIRAVEGFSEKGQAEVIEGYLADLAQRADHFLAVFPLEHESYHFRYEYALFDSGLIYSFRFVVDGSRMEMGVVRVVYVEHETITLPS